MARLVEAIVACVALASCAHAGRIRAIVSGKEITVVQTDLRLALSDGRVLHSAGLVGTDFDLGEVTVRLEGVNQDPSAPGVILHHFVIVSRKPEAELCEPDANGEYWAIPVVDEHNNVQLVCTSGAIGKCIRWGYAPWRSKALHQACVRMARADYGGDGQTATRDGTLIRFCDHAGVHPCPPDIPQVEASWAPDGAVCVGYPRIPALLTLKDLAERYPRLVGMLGSSCSGDALLRGLIVSWTAAPQGR